MTAEPGPAIPRGNRPASGPAATIRSLKRVPPQSLALGADHLAPPQTPDAARDIGRTDQTYVTKTWVAAAIFSQAHAMATWVGGVIGSDFFHPRRPA